MGGRFGKYGDTKRKAKLRQSGHLDRKVKKKTKEFFEKVRSKDKTYREYDGFLHELWNEKGRAQVYQDMFVWLEKHL